MINPPEKISINSYERLKLLIDNLPKVEDMLNDYEINFIDNMGNLADRDGVEMKVSLRQEWAIDRIFNSVQHKLGVTNNTLGGFDRKYNRNRMKIL